MHHHNVYNSNIEVNKSLTTVHSTHPGKTLWETGKLLQQDVLLRQGEAKAEKSRVLGNIWAKLLHGPVQFRMLGTAETSGPFPRLRRQPQLSSNVAKLTHSSANPTKTQLQEKVSWNKTMQAEY